jgi:hypothetical protein
MFCKQVGSVRATSQSSDIEGAYCQPHLPMVRPAIELTRLWRLLIWQDNSDYVLVAATVH